MLLLFSIDHSTENKEEHDFFAIKAHEGTIGEAMLMQQDATKELKSEEFFVPDVGDRVKMRARTQVKFYGVQENIFSI